jgi:alanine racemase
MYERPTRANLLEIDLAALRANHRMLRERLAPETKVIASIKADAYGHSAVPVARVLEEEGVHALATGSFDDAVKIREAGIATPILLFGSALPEAMPDVLAHRLIPTIHNEENALAVSRSANRPTPVYVKVDCGLRRLGIALSEAFEFVCRLHQLENVIIEGIYTHVPFENADGRAWARGQLAEFGKLLTALANAGINVPVTQAMASSCLLAGLEDSCNAVCPGHMLYGLSPVQPDVADIAPYRPVARRLCTRLIHVGHHPIEDEPRFERAASGNNKAQAVGVVPLGRYDGYRNPSPGKRASMLIRGRRAPVLGVSLEHAMLGLDGLENPVPGDTVIALGEAGNERIDLNEIGNWWNFSPLDVLMTLDRRVDYRFIDN